MLCNEEKFLRLYHDLSVHASHGEFSTGAMWRQKGFLCSFFTSHLCQQSAEGVINAPFYHHLCLHTSAEHAVVQTEQKKKIVLNLDLSSGEFGNGFSGSLDV